MSVLLVAHAGISYHGPTGLHRRDLDREVRAQLDTEVASGAALGPSGHREAPGTHDEDPLGAHIHTDAAGGALPPARLHEHVERVRQLCRPSRSRWCRSRLGRGPTAAKLEAA